MEYSRIQVTLSVLFLIHYLKLYPYNWPIRSPDLSHSDFLLRFVKDEVFGTPVRYVTQLKPTITRAIIVIQRETLQKVWKNIENRLHAMIREDIEHVDHLQLYTKTFTF